MPADPLTEHFLKYFKVFRDLAPKTMVEWGGYQSGEPSGMASSLESCVALYDFMENKQATVLNGGAGASSWVFRKLLPSVICTDPDAAYLDAVAKICGGSGYIHDIENCPVCDYVYWDYGNWQRIPLMEKGFSLARIAMYVDDCHDPEVLACVQEMAAKHQGRVVETNSMDSFGRFGVILSRA